MPLGKPELISEIAKRAALKKVEAEKALDAILKTIGETLSKGDQVRLIGFGTFRVANRKARKGRNPRTGATLNIPAKKGPRFSPGVGLVKAVQGKK